MYMPNLMPGDVHRLWTAQSELKPSDSHRRPTTSQGSDSAANYGLEYPSMPSYTAAFPDPLQPSASTAWIRQKMFVRSEGQASGLNDESSTLDQISLEIATQIQILKRLGQTGYESLRPIGVGKTMKQISDDNRQRQEPSQPSQVQQEQPSAEFAAATVSAGSGLVVSGENTREIVADLDAELSDRDASDDEELLSAEEDNDVVLRRPDAVSIHEDDMDDASDRIAEQVDAEASQFFMASEEYQQDHAIAEHVKRRPVSFSFIGSSSFNGPGQPHTGTAGTADHTLLPSTPPEEGSRRIIANSGATSATTMSSAPSQMSANPVLETGFTSASRGIELDTSDHDMVVE